MSTVGIDAGVYERESETSTFKAPMGVAVTIRDRDRFRKKYDDTLNDLFEKYNQEKIKPVYKAAYITKQLKHQTNEFVREFLSQMSSELQRIDVFYTYYPEGSVEDIIVCKDSYPRKCKPEKFTRDIEKGYEHYCLWKYCVEYPTETNNLFEVDFFQSRVTPAWDYINDLDSFSIFYSGGECNKSISMADIILRLINNTCKGDLDHSNIFYCLKEYAKNTSIKSFWMGPRRDYLNNMAWRDNLDIDTTPNIPRPIFWIAWSKYTNDATEKVSLEWSNPYNEVMKRAEASFASVRFWDPREFPLQANKETDIVFLLNEKAMPILESIRYTSPGIRTVDFRPGAIN